MNTPIRLMEVFDLSGRRIGVLRKGEVSDWSIEREVNSYSTMSFSVPYDSPGASLLRGEYRIRIFKKDWKTYKDEFIIREIEDSRSSDNKKIKKVSCELNVSELTERICHIVEQLSVTQKVAMDTVLENTGWVCYQAQSTKIRSYQDVFDQNVLEMTQKIREIWSEVNQYGDPIEGGYISYNSIARTMSLLNGVGADRETSFVYRKNVKSLTRTEDYREMATVIWPFGDNDVTVHDVNNGQGYIENYSWYTGYNPFTEERIPEYGIVDPDTGSLYTVEKARQLFKKEKKWSDSNFVEAEALLEAAKKHSYESCKPKISYKIDILDLYSITGEDEYDIGDKVNAIDPELGINIKAQVIKMTEYPLEPQKNSVEIANFKDNMAQLLKQTIRSGNLVVDRQGGIGAIGKLGGVNKILRGQMKLVSDSVDGGLTLIEAQDDKGSIKVTTGGITIKPNNGEEFTAMDGYGISASAIYTGTLNAGLVTIISDELTKNEFYWNQDGLISKNKNKPVEYSHLDHEGLKVFGASSDPDVPEKKVHIGYYTDPLDDTKTKPGILMHGGYIDIIGGLPDSQIASASTWNTVATNFDTRNDRISTTPANPTLDSTGSCVDHTTNTDGSCNLSFEWSFTGSGEAYDIDGFILYINAEDLILDGNGDPTNTSHNFDNCNSESTYYVTPDKRSILFYGVSINKAYTLGIQAYRLVDSDIATGGIIKSTIVKPSYTGENPYVPSVSVAFNGNVLGTINGTPASTVSVNATNSVQRNNLYTNGLKWDDTLGLIITSSDNAYKATTSGTQGYRIQYQKSVGVWEDRFWAKIDGSLFVKGIIDCDDLKINGTSILTSGKISKDYIEAYSVTAEILKTASSGARVEIDGTNYIRTYDASEERVRVSTDRVKFRRAGADRGHIMADTLSIPNVDPKDILHIAGTDIIYMSSGNGLSFQLGSYYDIGGGDVFDPVAYIKCSNLILEPWETGGGTSINTDGIILDDSGINWYGDNVYGLPIYKKIQVYGDVRVDNGGYLLSNTLYPESGEYINVYGILDINGGIRFEGPGVLDMWGESIESIGRAHFDHNASLTTTDTGGTLAYGTLGGVTGLYFYSNGTCYRLTMTAV